jgi:hypothetical protein
VRAYAETEWSAILSVSEVLVCARACQPRKAELIWTRYLPVCLQRCILNDERWPGEVIRAEVSAFFERLLSWDGDGTILYFIVPRKTTKWYVGITQRCRKWGKGVGNGFLVRYLEHIEGVTGKNARKQGRGKYAAWRSFPLDAIQMIPILVEEDARAASIEEYIISRDQPGANCRGRKVERAECWELRQINLAKGPRQPRTKRLPTSVQ